MTQYPWQVLLKQDLNQLRAHLTEPKESGGSLLYWIIKKDHLKFDKYLQWAQKHYGFAYLQAQFFSSAKDPKIWHKYIHHYKWNKECLPVGEWEDTLIVACLEPPQDLPQYPKIIPVLAAPHDMEVLWAHYNNENFFSFDTQEEKTKTQIEVSEESKSTEFPAGWADEPATRIIPNFKDGSAIPDPPTMIRPRPKLNKPEEEAPAGLDTAIPAQVLKAPATPEDFEPTMIRPVATTASAPENFPPSPISSVGDDNEPTMIRSSTEASEVLTLLNDADNEPTIIRPRTAVNLSNVPNTITPAAKSSSNEEDSETSDASGFNIINHPEYHKHFKNLEAHYEKSMIFLNQDEKLLAYSWSESFHPHKVKLQNPVLLNSASIFKIAHRTQKSFHGPVSLNDANEEYFEHWNQGQTPDHVTITPLVEGEKTIGLLISFADGSVNKKASLALHEKVAEAIKDQLLKDLTQKLAS